MDIAWHILFCTGTILNMWVAPIHLHQLIEDPVFLLTVLNSKDIFFILERIKECHWRWVTSIHSGVWSKKEDTYCVTNYVGPRHGGNFLRCMVEPATCMNLHGLIRPSIYVEHRHNLDQKVEHRHNLDQSAHPCTWVKASARILRCIESCRYRDVVYRPYRPSWTPAT